MTREQEIADFFKQLKEFRFWHSMCGACRMLEEEWKNCPDGNRKLCVECWIKKDRIFGWSGTEADDDNLWFE